MADGFVLVETSIGTGVTGSLDLVASGGKAFGSVPTGVLLIATSTPTADNAGRCVSIAGENGAWVCLGARARDNRSAASGTNGCHITHDGLGATANAFIRLISYSGTGAMLDADFTALITNGVRINIGTNLLTAAATVFMLLWYGDTECGVDAIEVLTSAEETFSSFGLSGEPSMAILIEDFGFGTSSTSALQHAIGFAVNDEALSQCAVAIQSEYSSGTLADTLVTDSYALNRAGTTSPNFDRIEVTAFGSDSISVIRRNYSAGAVPRFGCMLVRFADWEARASAVLTDTDPAPHTQSVDAELSVLGGILVGSRAPNLDTHNTSGPAWADCVGLFDDGDNYVVSISNEDGADPTQATTFEDNTIAFAVPTNAGAFTASASHKASVAPAGSGFDLDYTLTDEATARYFTYLVWGLADVVSVVDEDLELSEHTGSILGHVTAADEDLELSEHTGSILGDVVSVPESLSLTEGTVIVTTDEVFSSETKGDIDQGTSFRGDIEQPGALGDIER